MTHSGPEVFFKTCVATKFVDDDDDDDDDDSDFLFNGNYGSSFFALFPAYCHIR